MCGIAGMVGFGNEALIRAMTDTIVHRGPDGEGFYADDGVYLGNRRLAILDVAGGTQPMSNEDGSVVVVYNGEIYNYPEMRDHLLRRGHRLSTTCDTEILPHLYEEHGIGFLSRLNGIFAFALFDRSRRKLFLVRDPIGVKPLVYAIRDRQLAFGSEAKAVLASGLVTAELDEPSLHLSMNVRYVPGDRTFFRHIRRLPPGHVLEFGDGEPRCFRYAEIDWTPDETLTRSDWMEGIRHHYEAAVKRQLLSDVPLGVSLSGGIDSSSIVAMLRSSTTGPIKTFSLGFGEPGDELDDARFVARTFETDHHEIVLHEPALSYLGDAIRHTEEPKVNSLQLYLLHRFIGEHVTVALSGLGGDELFAGYDFYGYLGRSRWLRSRAGGVARALAPALDWTARRTAALGRPQLDLATRKLEWLASAGDGARHYLLLRNAWDFNSALLRRVYTPEFVERLGAATRDSYDDYFSGARPLEAEALHAEFGTKMVADLLHNEDTMSMAHSVESRVPLLDLELVGFVARIPDRIRFETGPKGLLKEALRGSVLPDRVVDKEKRGFTFDPVEQYKKDLGSMARSMLTPERLRLSGIFNPEFVRSVVDAKPHQRFRWHYFLLWQMIGVELWQETFTHDLVSQPKFDTRRTIQSTLRPPRKERKR